MVDLIVNPSELRSRGFEALCSALGWVNAVRYLRQYEPGQGNYTEERRSLLPDWDAKALAEAACRAERSP